MYMKRASKEPAATKAEKIAALVRTLRDTQAELQSLTGKQLGRLAGEEVLTHIDITNEKLAEQRLVRINQLYAVLSKVNEAIIRTQHEHQLFELVCRIAV